VPITIVDLGVAKASMGCVVVAVAVRAKGLEATERHIFSWAHHDRPPFLGRPSLTGHCGHGWTCSLPRPVAIDPFRHLPSLSCCAAQPSSRCGRLGRPPREGLGAAASHN
jgi:hypothetical protein